MLSFYQQSARIIFNIFLLPCPLAVVESDPVIEALPEKRLHFIRSQMLGNTVMPDTARPSHQIADRSAEPDFQIFMHVQAKMNMIRHYHLLGDSDLSIFFLPILQGFFHKFSWLKQFSSRQIFIIWWNHRIADHIRQCPCRLSFQESDHIIWWPIVIMILTAPAIIRMKRLPEVSVKMICHLMESWVRDGNYGNAIWGMLTSFAPHSGCEIGPGEARFRSCQACFRRGGPLQIMASLLQSGRPASVREARFRRGRPASDHGRLASVRRARFRSWVWCERSERDRSSFSAIVLLSECKYSESFAKIKRSLI